MSALIFSLLLSVSFFKYHPFNYAGYAGFHTGPKQKNELTESLGLVAVEVSNDLVRGFYREFAHNPGSRCG